MLGVVVGFVGIAASVVGWPVVVYTLACCVQVWWSVVREVLAVKIEGKNFVTSTGMVRLIFAPDPRLVADGISDGSQDVQQDAYPEGETSIHQECLREALLRSRRSIVAYRTQLKTHQSARGLKMFHRPRRPQILFLEKVEPPRPGSFAVDMSQRNRWEENLAVDCR